MHGQLLALRKLVQLLDPPLHEFLPHTDQEMQALAKELGTNVEAIRNKVVALHEANPMLGHRGCRLGISYPEITEMQARAIFQAAVECAKDGVTVIPEIMIPLVADVKELERQRAVVDRVAREVIGESGQQIPYSVGTMIDHGKPIAPNIDNSAPASACETPAMSTRTTGSQAKHA